LLLFKRKVPKIKKGSEANSIKERKMIAAFFLVVLWLEFPKEGLEIVSVSFQVFYPKCVEGGPRPSIEYSTKNREASIDD